MNALIKKTFVVSAVFVALFGATIENAAAWTLSASGTIDQGYDFTGVFGAVGSLTGKAYSQVYTLDPYLYSYTGGDALHSFGNGVNSGTVTETVTVGGISHTYDLTSSLDQYGSSGLSAAWTNGQVDTDGVGQLVSGYLADGTYFSSSVTVGAYAPFVSSLDFNQASFSAKTGIAGVGGYGVNFGLSNNSGPSVFFGSTDVLININAVAAVPEPDTIAMLLAGLGLMGAVIRRRKGRQA